MPNCMGWEGLMWRDLNNILPAQKMINNFVKRHFSCEQRLCEGGCRWEGGQDGGKIAILCKQLRS